jgi:hypothetical protein
VPDPFEGWAIVELMGHRRLAGHVTEQEIAGHGFLRLDVHDGNGPVTTQFYSPSSVYCLTPSTEEIARALGARLRPAPVSRYELEPPKLAAVRDQDDDDDPYPEDDLDDDEVPAHPHPF